MKKLESIACSLLCSLLLFCFFSISGCSAESNAPLLKVGFILTGSASDRGWNYAHDQGRQFLEKALKGRVQTDMVDNVPENAQVERVAEKMIAQGDKLIFSTSYGFLDPLLRVAARHPDVIFMQCQRHSTAKNVGTYYAVMWEPFYIGGYLAGKMTKTNKLGFLGGHPVPVCIASLNSYALGARAANPKVRVKVVWNNSWQDPANEAEATKGLIESGVDVILSELNTASTVVQTAEKGHIYSIGTEVDMRDLAPKGWLIGQTFNWGPLYVKIANSVLDKTWKAANTVYPMKDGYVGVTTCGEAVPSALRREAAVLLRKITDGSLVIFKGPLPDRDGKLQVAAGKVASAHDIENMTWAVPGVDGVIPK